MARPLSRVTPGAPAQAFETFAIKAPLATHWRAATCAELCARADDMRRRAAFVPEEERADWLAEADSVECGPHRNGWRTTVLAGSDDLDLLRQACRGEVDGHHRRHIELPQPDGFVQLVFEPGQACLAVGRHKLRADRPETYLRRNGDWRAHLGARRIYDRPDQWADDFEAHTEAIKPYWG